jgi:transmembrane protein 222
MNATAELPDERQWMHSEGICVLDETDQRTPCTVVWTALPVITWICPFIGHVGITDSEGLVTDFSGPYTVTVGSLLGGPARRIWKLDIDDFRRYDKAVHEGAACYGKRMHKYVNAYRRCDPHSSHHHPS